MRLLPLPLFFLCQAFLYPTVGGKQCRLKVNNNLAGSSASSTPPAATGTSSNTGNPTNPTLSASTSSASQPTPTFTYGKDTIRAVNLGGWFVLEPWITPSIFEDTNNDAIVDEYTYGQLQDRETATKILTNHWNTWITEADFIAIAAAGLNHVRIPLGYWSVPITSADTKESTSNEPYIMGAWDYLLRALNWAHAHNIRVILDLHGAPGSQNGYDNSGQRTYPPTMQANPSNVTRTVDTLRYIAKNIGGLVDVLELLNEPAGFFSDEYAAVIRQFWLDGYAAVREVAGPNIRIMIGDAFRGVESWTNFLTWPNYQGVMMDYHEYQIFDNSQLARTFDQHIDVACSQIPNLVSFSSNNIWTIVGEWSNAVTDCTKWLNGKGVGARWDASRQQPDSHYFGSCEGWSGSYSSFSEDYKTFLRKYWEVQVEMGERVQGWSYWTWKAENSDEWSYQKGLEGGWIPHDPSDRKYPNICP